MSPMRSHVLVLVTGVVVIASGCFGQGFTGSETPLADDGLAYPRGVHPYPQGDEWPADLDGPFSLKAIEPFRLASHDGVEIQGWTLQPDVPENVRLPVVLYSTPYFSPGWAPVAKDPGAGVSLPVMRLLSAGIAVAFASVRGTGDSGGCFANKGLAEQLDQAALVEWLAAQPWSNGRIGMAGLSYHGTTPLEAAVQAPPALKAVYVMGTVADQYTEMHTPQGAMYTGGGTGDTFRRASYGAATLGPDSLDEPMTGLSVQSERVCPGYLEVLTVSERGHVTDDRTPDYWNERRLLTRFPDITAAVYISHGLAERDHPIQDDPLWEALTNAPKRMQLGQWGHEVPPVESWELDVVEWFRFWLQGVGEAPPGLGLVEYETADGEWLTTSHWPPAETREEVLYLDGGLLDAEASTGRAGFRSVPLPAGPESVLCPVDTSAVRPEPWGLVFESLPLAENGLLAGNPLAFLQVESDAPGGIVAVHLFAVEDDLACQDGRATGARLLSQGAADLRFHHGNLVGEDFPTGTVVPLRIDLSNLAAEFTAGERFLVVVSYGYPFDPDHDATEFLFDGGRWGRSGEPYAPVVMVSGAGDDASSHIVLPFLRGSLGGWIPTVEYPPRPFTPTTG